MADVVFVQKAGWKTSEFWLMILSNVLVYAGGLPVPHGYEKYKPLFTAATLVGYFISRGLAKSNPAAPSVTAKTVPDADFVTPPPSDDPKPPGAPSAPGATGGADIIPGH